MLEDPWTKTPEEIFQYFSVDPASGLTSDLAVKHAELYGKNGESSRLFYLWQCLSNDLYLELPEDPPNPLWELILEQFKDQLVLILLASAVISFVLALLEDNSDGTWWSAFVEPLVILLILVANAAVGVIQETNAEKAIDVRSLLTLYPKLY
jgi:P-type Ca2+ transporter type 2A